MDLDLVTLNEVTQRKRNIVWYPLYVESKQKKKDTNELIYKTETESQREQIYGNGGGWGEE